MTRWPAPLLLGIAALGSPLPSLAAPDAATLHVRTLAAVCAQCHGTDGRALEGEGMARLAGVPKDALLTQLIAFRDGTRPATVMQQLTKGFTPAQLEQIAAYFAAQKP